MNTVKTRPTINSLMSAARWRTAPAEKRAIETLVSTAAEYGLYPWQVRVGESTHTTHTGLQIADHVLVSAAASIHLRNPINGDQLVVAYVGGEGADCLADYNSTPEHDQVMDAVYAQTGVAA